MKYSACDLCNRTISLSNFDKHLASCKRKLYANSLPKKKRGRPFGCKAWNKGLTAKTNSRLAKMASTLSLVYKNKVKNGTYVVPSNSDVAKQKISLALTGNNHGGKCKWYDVGLEKVQGRWERDLALKMTDLDITWKKKGVKPYRYVDFSGKIRHYTPDFFLKEFDVLLEIKGYWWGNDRQKMQSIFEQYPNIKIVIIEKSTYLLLLSTNTKVEFLACLIDNTKPVIKS